MDIFCWRLCFLLIFSSEYLISNSCPPPPKASTLRKYKSWVSFFLLSHLPHPATQYNLLCQGKKLLLWNGLALIYTNTSCGVPSSPPSNIFTRAQASWFLFWTRVQRGKLWSAFPLSRPFLGVGKWIALKNTLPQRLTRKSLGKSVSQHKLGSSTVFCECEENMNYGSRPCKVLTKKEKKKRKKENAASVSISLAHMFQYMDETSV